MSTHFQLRLPFFFKRRWEVATFDICCPLARKIRERNNRLLVGTLVLGNILTCKIAIVCNACGDV